MYNQIYPYSNPKTYQQGLSAQPFFNPIPGQDLVALFEQAEADGVAVHENKFLFGVHSTRPMRDVPIEYLLQIHKVVKGIRRAIMVEVRRRAVVQRFQEK